MRNCEKKSFRDEEQKYFEETNECVEQKKTRNRQKWINL